MWSTFVAVVRKELIHILRDRRMLVMLMLAPALQLIILGYLDLNVRDLPTDVVDQDLSYESRELVDKLRATSTFEIHRFVSSPSEARADIISGKARVAVILPIDFHDKRSRGAPAEVLVLLDGSDSTVSSQALAAINGIAADMSSQSGAGPITVRDGAVVMKPILLFNAEGSTANFLIPGMIVVLLQFGGVMMTSASIVRERESGTLEQLLVAPVHTGGLMLGKLLPFAVVEVFQLTVVLIIMTTVFHVPIHGSIPLLYASSSLFMFAILALGLFISSRAQSQAQAMQMTMMQMLPAMMLSGYIFPRSGLPMPLYLIGELIPTTHMISIVRGIVQRDAGITDILWDVGALLVLTFILLRMSVRGFSSFRTA